MNFGASRTQKETCFHFAETPPKVMGAAYKMKKNDGERFVHRQSLLNYRIITFTLLPPTFTTAISPLGIEVLIRASPFFTVAVPRIGGTGFWFLPLHHMADVRAAFLSLLSWHRMLVYVYSAKIFIFLVTTKYSSSEWIKNLIRALRSNACPSNPLFHFYIKQAQQ